MRRPSDAGVSLVDIMIVLALIGILSGIAVPMIGNLSESLELGTNAREVERELQTARLRAVTSNRPIRVRFNCPVAGQYRMVELIGPASAPNADDASATRCQESAYPFPAADSEPLTRPNHDGPLRYLSDDVSFGTASSLEFRPDGTVRQQSGTTVPWPVVSGTTQLTLVKGTAIETITVNALGKITLVQ